MKRWLVIVVLIAVVAFIFVQALRERERPSRPTHPSHEEAVKQALDGYHRVASKHDKDPNVATYLKVLGFASPQEVAAATPGSPTRIYSVSAKGLKTFMKDGNLKTLLVDTHQVIYPLLIKGKTKSSIYVAELKPNAWRVTMKGVPELNGLIDQYIKSSGSFFVTVGLLNLHFIGETKSGQLMLIPTSDVDIPGLKLHAGVEVPAERTFHQLASYMESYKEKPTGVRKNELLGQREKSKQ